MKGNTQRRLSRFITALTLLSLCACPAATPPGVPEPVSQGGGDPDSAVTAGSADSPSESAVVSLEQLRAEDPGFVLRDDDGTLPSPPMLVLLHGYGSDENDLASIADLVSPSWVAVALRAPTSLGEGRFAWYPLTFGDNGPSARPEDVQSATQALVVRLQQHVATHGAEPGRVHLLGFSQGAMMSQQVAAVAPELVASIGLFGARLTLDTPHAARDTPTPVFMAHGLQDTVVPYTSGTALRDSLPQDLYTVVWNEFDGPHTMPPSLLRQWATWVTAIP